ncbi:MAG: methylated-DNA--[protein]-cysteine S-methyltransferase [Alphaproteobacteria bacterium]|nr:methylated-DNA--[protein]-cysteine S-methyltransferase [Alphaproteobacteria bacterium]MBV9694114.1 methylated-DNA--[protein]-cysteine S-methyltransferase [Alphaproteobacteria bacterium]
MSEIVAMPPREGGPDWKRVAHAIRFLSEHYLEQPSLDEAASAVGLSPFHFQRLFTRYAGVSPKSFVGHLTLDHAKRDLAQGRSVLDAALDAGLSGPSRLHDLCLKIEAMTPGDYARGAQALTIDYGMHDCPFGRVLVMTTHKGVCGIAFGNDGEEDTMLADMRARWPLALYRENAPRAGAIAKLIFEDAKGDISLHLMGTKWQIKVWQALLAIPPGKVMTYRALARGIGNDGASRAVGAAVGRNPVSWLIPCHRVLGSKGAITGYHWGIKRKRAMLALEAARYNPSTSAIA